MVVITSVRVCMSASLGYDRPRHHWCLAPNNSNNTWNKNNMVPAVSFLGPLIKSSNTIVCLTQEVLSPLNIIKGNNANMHFFSLSTLFFEAM